MNSELKNVKKLIVSQSLELDCGKTIKNFPVAYETYGTLNKNKSNAILAFHALFNIGLIIVYRFFVNKKEDLITN